MTSEQRLDRLERIALLLAKAGYRARKDVREQLRAVRQQGEILMDAQMRTEARFQQNEVRFERLSEAQIKLTESQAHTDRRLDALIDIIRGGRN